MAGVFWASFGILWAVVAVQGVVLLRVLRQGAGRTTPGPVILRALPRGRSLSAVLPEGLGVAPVARTALDAAPVGVVLLTSATCAVCRVVAREAFAFGRRSPQSAALVVVQGSRLEYEAFAAETQSPHGSCVHDEPGALASHLGIPFVPTAIVVEKGIVTDAAALSGPDQLVRYITRSPRIHA